ncbi:hypothetical protein [Streptomyces griseosporeus]|uniref:SCO2400 family protein n=1 Tax=Streptomyces griseosporeus TaxID=1910 RepID=UPI00370359A7
MCPGCGAYAPDIAPPVVTSPLGSEQTVGAFVVAPDAPWSDDDPVWEPASRTVQDGPSADVTAVTATRPGRAARRRQLARLKKHQRRAMVATAFALVGGGLSLATLDRHTAGPAQAATTPDDRAMGGAKDQVREEPTLPGPTSPATPRPPHSAPDEHGSAEHASDTGIPRQQPVHATSVTEPRPVAPAATAPRTVVVSSPQGQTGGTAAGGGTASTVSSSSGTSGASGTAGTSGTSGTSGTATQPAPAPTTGDTSGAGADSQDSAPAATSPAQLCLLGLCLG